MANRALLALLMIGVFFAAVIVISYAISSILHAGRTGGGAGKLCSNCQKRVPMQAKYCPRCGRRFEEA